MSKVKKWHPTIGVTFETDQQAMRIFEAWLPDSWLKRKQQPDIFLDYVVESTISGEPTGREYAFQLKGTRKVQVDNNDVLFSVKTKHIRYWLEHCKHPVFLVVVDVLQVKGWWLFLQKYAREEIAITHLKDKMHLRVRIPLRNTIEDFNRFEAGLSAAEVYVRDLHPSSIAAAIRKRRLEIEAKDPRFTVSVQATETSNSFRISPKPGVSVKAQLKTKKAADVRAFFEHAQEITLRHGEFTITGSPIFEELSNHQNVNLTITPASFPAAVQMESSSDARQMALINGSLRVGSKTMRFDSHFNDSALKISWSAERLAPNQPGDWGQFNIGFDENVWANQPILSLTHFDSVYNTIRCIAAGNQIEVTLFVREQFAMRGHFQTDNPETIGSYLAIVEWIYKAREVAKSLGAHPILPLSTDISEDQWGFVLDAYELLNGRRIVVPTNINTLSSEIDGPYRGAGLSVIGPLRIQYPDYAINFGGQRLSLGSVELYLSNVELVSAKSSSKGGTAFVFKTKENCLQITSREEILPSSAMHYVGKGVEANSSIQL